MKRLTVLITGITCKPTPLYPALWNPYTAVEDLPAHTGVARLMQKFQLHTHSQYIGSSQHEDIFLRYLQANDFLL